MNIEEALRYVRHAEQNIRSADEAARRSGEDGGPNPDDIPGLLYAAGLLVTEARYMLEHKARSRE